MFSKFRRYIRYKNRVTTKQQFDKLVELMEKHPETGRGKPQFGCSKNKTKELWEEFSVELNNLGPPSRTAQEWGRVWIHYKANLKRKLTNNRSNLLPTGGGHSQEVSLNPLEETEKGVDTIMDNFIAASSNPCEVKIKSLDRPTS
ncbi:uncharacterized protein LOC119604402 [Lucilia sericata]|uniref:uncharacterized protein LOC119604402 n=1 Tax=Lucilia sericata TaxID=13632 RepID=UPI0018A82602|nr:uncharacterized protein LOC119604402 [Lucilia sericata]